MSEQVGWWVRPLTTSNSKDQVLHLCGSHLLSGKIKPMRGWVEHQWQGSAYSKWYKIIVIAPCVMKWNYDYLTASFNPSGSIWDCAKLACLSHVHFYIVWFSYLDCGDLEIQLVITSKKHVDESNFFDTSALVKPKHFAPLSRCRVFCLVQCLI